MSGREITRRDGTVPNRSALCRLLRALPPRLGNSVDGKTAAPLRDTVPMPNHPAGPDRTECLRRGRTRRCFTELSAIVTGSYDALADWQSAPELRRRLSYFNVSAGYQGYMFSRVPID